MHLALETNAVKMCTHYTLHLICTVSSCRTRHVCLRWVRLRLWGAGDWSCYFSFLFSCSHYYYVNVHTNTSSHLFQVIFLFNGNPTHTVLTPPLPFSHILLSSRTTDRVSDHEVVGNRGPPSLGLVGLAHDSEVFP